MNYLTEVHIGGVGWRPFKFHQSECLECILARIRELCPGDEIHDMRVKALLPIESPAAQASVISFWGSP